SARRCWSPTTLGRAPRKRGSYVACSPRELHRYNVFAPPSTSLNRATGWANRQGSNMVSAFVTTLSRVLGSYSRNERSIASCGDEGSWEIQSLHRRFSTMLATSKMDRLRWCAAMKSPANSLTAREFQKSDSTRVDSRVSDCATRNAWRRLLTPSRGFHVSPSSHPGSRRWTCPRVARHVWVLSTTSFFTLVTTTGPVQVRMAGTTNDDVLPAWVGPTTNRECPRSRRVRGPKGIPFHDRRPSDN